MTERNPADVQEENIVSYSLQQPIPPTICIKANDGRALLTIKPDGTVTGDIDDASDAAKVFCESLRDVFQQEKAEIERLRAALQQSRSAVGIMYETLNYVREASECEQSRKAASETLAIADAALSQESADART